MTEQSDQIVASQPGEVDRSLTIDRDGTSQRTVQSISRGYPTTAEDLWEACTRPDRLARWFAPVSGDLKLGGRYQVQGNASGEVVACEPPRSFTVTWEAAEDTSRVTVRVAPEGASARLTLEHDHSGDADSEFWARFGPGATGVGWDLALLGLALHLITGQERPGDPEAFLRTSAAQQFIRTVSRSWGQASIDAGTSTAAATAAADRTTAFYLGEQPT